MQRPICAHEKCQLWPRAAGEISRRTASKNAETATTAVTAASTAAAMDAVTAAPAAVTGAVTTAVTTKAVIDPKYRAKNRRIMKTKQ